MRSDRWTYGGAVVLAFTTVACVQPTVPEGRTQGIDSVPALRSGAGTIDTWFDLDTARELMDARRAFDEAELGAIEVFNRSMGEVAVRVSMSIERHQRQESSAELRRRAWTTEQRQRSALAGGPKDASIDVAEMELRRRTLTALNRFFAQERRAGRMAEADYTRVVGGELGTGSFPSIRRRKWTGPAVLGFRASIATPTYRAVLQEVRRLWAAEASGARVRWVEPNSDFYRRL